VAIGEVHHRKIGGQGRVIGVERIWVPIPPPRYLGADLARGRRDRRPDRYSPNGGDIGRSSTPPARWVGRLPLPGMTDQLSTERRAAHDAVIGDALAVIDDALGRMMARELVSSGEVADVLLDVRTLLTTKVTEAPV
jgi:hypothetical protein